MRRVIRFLVGALLGLGALVGYLAFVGVDSVVSRATAIAPWAAAAVLALVVAEGLADAIGVWASIRPLGRGLSAGQSVQFAMAGDFFDTLSPAGPVSSEPIMARFIGVTTETTYSEALGVRSVAKYVKSGAQLLVSTALGLLVLVGGTTPQYVLLTLGGAVVGLVVLGGLLLYSRSLLSRLFVVVLTPVVALVSSLYREEAHGRSVVVDAVERFWERIVQFRTAPELLVLVALGGVLEQLLTAAALWVALAGTGTTVALLPILVVIPLPQVASVVPIPGSIGAYDILLGGALVAMTGAPAAGAAAAVLVVRTMTLPFGLSVGGVCVAFLRGWRP
ncbi:Lysylphosphatidylglycerol synthase TM region [Halogranum gelatinilyticum]|uniref:Lysylphosphatidylglycerol synthase TM region n=1 Tax=Halogranum gelatinilyticum TaxID=660521 RepID=A0A1G9PCS4_9EURY|nr:lysylphosphatidylglycerol synthase domain-containing protein [Halogranum gelatinilyticum]SDL96662.1 Lysylphosphatidylglycerol synthase TM region [Halogranum gelatinilyticum]